MTDLEPLHQDLLQLREEVSLTSRQLRSVYQQLKKLETKVQALEPQVAQTSGLEQEVVQQLGELESRLRGDLQMALDRLQRISFQPMGNDRVDRLESQVNNLWISHKDLSQRLKLVNYWVIITLILGVMALLISL